MNSSDVEHEIRFLIPVFDKSNHKDIDSYRSSLIKQYYYSNVSLNRDSGMLSIVLDGKTYKIYVPGNIDIIPDNICVRQRVLRECFSEDIHILTIKGPKIDGVGFEREWIIKSNILPIESEDKVISCLRKIRYELNCDNYKIEIDVFQDDLKGLIIAEIENPPHNFQKPDWFGEDITNNHSYSNLILSAKNKKI